DAGGALVPVADLARAGVAGGVGDVVAVGGAAAVLVQLHVAAVDQAVGLVAARDRHAVHLQRLAVELGAEVLGVVVDVLRVHHAAATLCDVVRSHQPGEAVHRAEVEADHALAVGAAGRVHGADVAAGAAVLRVHVGLDLAAVHGVAIAIGV